jgi:hypothetical protein
MLELPPAEQHVPHPIHATVRNRILSALPAEEFKLIADKLHRVELTLGQSLHRAGEPIEQIYFVDSGFISALTMLSEGQPLEIGLIGAEGVAGVGVRRSTVSIAASTLQKAGVIRYQHGRITIVDRVGLENAACECYEAVASEYRALFGEHPLDSPAAVAPLA